MLVAYYEYQLEDSCAACRSDPRSHDCSWSASHHQCSHSWSDRKGLHCFLPQPLPPCAPIMYHKAMEVSIWALPPRRSWSRTVGLVFKSVSTQRFSLAYCAAVRFRNTPPLPISITWSSACRLSRFDRPPPRSTISITFSGDVKRSFLGNGVLRSSSRNESKTRRLTQQSLFHRKGS